VTIKHQPQYRKIDGNLSRYALFPLCCFPCRTKLIVPHVNLPLKHFNLTTETEDIAERRASRELLSHSDSVRITVTDADTWKTLGDF